jgi:uncharacterized protein (TIGR02391 family)
MASFDPFEEETLQAICDVLGDTENGLTGGQIGRLLNRVGIDDPTPTRTKRYRLFNALHQRQQDDGSGNAVVKFIHAAMKPVSYTNRRDQYAYLREELNVALAFAGLSLGEDGVIQRTPHVQTLSNAEKRAESLQKKLDARGVHDDVLKFCRAELLQDNYFHAVFEATKSVADKLRRKADVSSDGARLVDEALALGRSGTPVLAINALETKTERSEQKGFANLVKGLFGTFRNTTAHAPKIRWDVDEQDALDLFSLASLCHRRIDSAANVQDESDGRGK